MLLSLLRRTPSSIRQLRSFSNVSSQNHQSQMQAQTLAHSRERGLRILFFGSDRFSALSLKALVDHSSLSLPPPPADTSSQTPGSDPDARRRATRPIASIEVVIKQSDSQRQSKRGGVADRTLPVTQLLDRLRSPASARVARDAAVTGSLLVAPTHDQNAQRDELAEFYNDSSVAQVAKLALSETTAVSVNVPTHNAPANAATDPIWDGWSFATASGRLFPMSDAEIAAAAVKASKADEHYDAYPFDLGVVISFGAMIPERVLRSFRLGAINIHPSLLPKYRGAAPIHRAIMAGDTETGVSILTVTPHKFDVGSILLQKHAPLPVQFSATEAVASLGRLGAQMLTECIQNLPAYLANSTPQAQKGGVMARKLTPDTSYLNFTNPAAQIANQCRALVGTVFTPRAMYEDKVVMLHNLFLLGLNPRPSWAPDVSLQTFHDCLVAQHAKAKLPGQPQATQPPGTIVFDNKHELLYVVCGDNQVVAIDGVTFEKRSKQSAPQFFHGYMTKALAAGRRPQFSALDGSMLAKPSV
ncbi:methionyl-tRNA formyltransferase [Capsaspora owczarzaki ATCC 30864]|uniref:Methionyl-tRNA formyltransferase n=1 Tax=Capsaspora owczarzaki (strain ATCC 30864) TaxID=595528 RepID=A0A0D2VZZ4_CAPO3|nr:methionyl-tRNA formyltransferase [Capsaspora owczarzaki ATCC 30864]KJE97462.1 methionyl-tRNA formyltransferase [Capsaspora owczarzaki ATCC 30864]|eukprot:XP_004343176.1 methionyl-tRNA formyltransferase [Capsaspora owczarzaki ATCC 30864]